MTSPNRNPRALELRRLHWAPRNAIARAAGQPEPEPDGRARLSPQMRRAFVAGIGDLNAPWRLRLIGDFNGGRS